MSESTYNQTVDDCRMHISRLETQMDELRNADPAQRAAPKRYLLKATWQNLQNDLGRVKEILHKYENEPSRYDKRSITSRKKQLNEIIDLIEGQLTQEYRELESQAN